MKNMSLRSILLLSLTSALVLNPAWGDSHMATNAFIEGEVALTPDPDRKGAYRYLKEGLDLSQYKRIIIMPVEIWIHPDSKYKGIQPDDLKALADTFRQLLVDELEPAFPVVDKAGSGTLVLRLAITGVKLKKKKRGLLGYTPVGLIVTTAMNAAGKRTSLAEAGIEAELIDASSDERLGVLVDKGIGAKSEKLSWEDIEMSLRFYAKRFRGRLDQAHGGAQ